MPRLMTVAHTLRYLSFGQAWTFFVRRALPPHRVRVTAAPVRRICSLHAPVCAVNTRAAGSEAFFWLNREQAMQWPIDWAPPNQSRLWQYHLHYFDVLRDPARSRESKVALVDDWIAHNPQGSAPAWEPYTASLRIVNWIAWFLSGELDEIPQSWLHSLYEQSLWLERNDERHILANHFFENIKALVFAGAFFEGADAQRWLTKSRRWLQQQLKEQFLPDGGHYERSPHYHALMLENVLDLFNLHRGNSDLFDQSLSAELLKVAQKGLVFLQGITLPGNRLPLFNDSSLESGHGFAELCAYAERLGLQFEQDNPQNELIHFADSGLYGIKQANNAFIIDCGDIGPSYQPGHTHCDFLSFEWIVDGQPVIVDSGLYEYTPGPMRDYVRSTAAHNTVAVDGKEQSEVWGAFRVARRARRIFAKAALCDQGEFCFEGAFQGFPQIKGTVRHQRKVRLNQGAEDLGLHIQDTISGQGTHQLDSRFHFHPDLSLERQGEDLVTVLRNGTPFINIRVAGDVSVTTTEGWYCPSFGLRYRNTVLVLSQTVALPASYEVMFERIVA